MTNNEKIEISNAKEELSELIEDCNSCGLCKGFDPISKSLGDESTSARGRCTLFSKGIFDKNVFDTLLDGSCRTSCPFGIDIDSATKKARKILNLQGKENQENKKILDKILNKQNPFEN